MRGLISVFFRRLVLRKQLLQSYKRYEIVVGVFYPTRGARKHRSGGGIGLIFNKNLKLKSNGRVKKYKSYQVMEFVLETNSGIIRLIDVYKPPYTKKARY